jgi:hypothetical protein
LEQAGASPQLKSRLHFADHAYDEGSNRQQNDGLSDNE